MGLNQKEHMTYGTTLDKDRTVHKISHEVIKDMMGINDFKSAQSCCDVNNVLPNNSFGTVFKMSPKETFDDDNATHLPEDPSGVDFTTTDHLNTDLSVFATVTAINDWIGFLLQANEFDDDKVSEFRRKIDDYYQILTELHFALSSSLKSEGETEVVEHESETVIDSANRPFEDNKLDEEVEESCFGIDIYQNELVKDDDRADSVSPNYAFKLVLDYLSITDLLNVEGVCRYLRDEVRNHVLWRHIKIDPCLFLKMNDERLMRLTDRAQGSLLSLDLFYCFNITNLGLRHVLKHNPKLTKLDLVGCGKVNVEGLLQDLNAFNTDNSPGIKHLRVGELKGLTNEHVKEFQSMLGAVNKGIKLGNCTPRYHLVDQIYLTLDDERALDVETCPKCEKPKQVFDCPLASCREKARSQNECRGCCQCIARCIFCGCCLGDKPYEETFCFEFCCMDCYKHHFPPVNREHEVGFCG